MHCPLNINDPAYDALIGTGGIGAGSFFAVSGNHTMGREESRGGRFLDRRDYCKLHIITHYVRTLLGPSFTALPVGRVGDDVTGRRLLDEMQAVGIDTRHVAADPGEPTLFSFCLLYPDGSGGNLTTENSACAGLDPAGVQAASTEFDRFRNRAIALAVPEVPIDVRATLLALATTHGSFRAASFTSGEIPEALRRGMLAQIDLLALNIDEAATLIGLQTAESTPAKIIAGKVFERLRAINPQLRLSVITAGKQGSWMNDQGRLIHQPIFNGAVISTAGAGDAFLAGVLVGLTAGLEPADAQQLGALTAGLAVTSPHTIHPGLDRNSLGMFAAETGVSLAPNIRHLLGLTE